MKSIYKFFWFFSVLYTPEDDRNIDSLAKKLARKPVAYEFLYPKLYFAGSWFYEQIDAKQYPELAERQGLGVDLMLNLVVSP